MPEYGYFKTALVSFTIRQKEENITEVGKQILLNGVEGQGLYLSVFTKLYLSEMPTHRLFQQKLILEKCKSHPHSFNLYSSLFIYPSASCLPPKRVSQAYLMPRETMYIYGDLIRQHHISMMYLLPFKFSGGQFNIKSFKSMHIVQFSESLLLEIYPKARVHTHVGHLQHSIIRKIENNVNG